VKAIKQWTLIHVQVETLKWLYITFYYVEDFGQQYMMCALEQVEDLATSINLTCVIMRVVYDLI
jgi:hypothetical protein